MWENDELAAARAERRERMLLYLRAAQLAVSAGLLIVALAKRGK